MSQYQYGMKSEYNAGYEVPVLGFTMGEYVYSPKPHNGWESNNNDTSEFNILEYIKKFDSQHHTLTIAMPGATVQYFKDKDIEKLNMFVAGWEAYMMPIKYSLEFSRAIYKTNRPLKKKECAPVNDLIKKRFSGMRDLDEKQFAVTFTGVNSFLNP